MLYRRNHRVTIVIRDMQRMPHAWHIDSPSVDLWRVDVFGTVGGPWRHPCVVGDFRYQRFQVATCFPDLAVVQLLLKLHLVLLELQLQLLLQLGENRIVVAA